jgi:hypothetical protein
MNWIKTAFGFGSTPESPMKPFVPEGNPLPSPEGRIAVEYEIPYFEFIESWDYLENPVNRRYSFYKNDHKVYIFSNYEDVDKYSILLQNNTSYIILSDYQGLLIPKRRGSFNGVSESTHLKEGGILPYIKIDPVYINSSDQEKHIFIKKTIYNYYRNYENIKKYKTKNTNHIINTNGSMRMRYKNGSKSDGIYVYFLNGKMELMTKSNYFNIKQGETEEKTSQRLSNYLLSRGGRRTRTRTRKTKKTRKIRQTK